MKRLLLLLFIQALGHQVLAVGKIRMETTGSASFLDADYTITTTGGALVVTDLTGAGETLEISENSGNIRFNVPGKTYRINSGAITAFTTPADIPISGKTGITIHAGAGDDVIDIGAFSTQLPALTINGDAGNDVVNFNGNITFAPGATLDLDLLNDGPAPGIDGLHLASGAQLLLSGTGTAVVKMGRSITLATGSLLQSQNGNITLEANYQPVANSESYIGIHIGGGTVEITGTGLLAIKGKGGVNQPNLRGIFVEGGGQIIGGTTGVVNIEGKGTDLASTFTAEGILLSDLSSKITSHGADIALVGFGGTSGGISSSYGVNISVGQVFAPGNANIAITGYGGLGTGLSIGVFVRGVIETEGGSITTNGAGSSYGTYLTIGTMIKTIGAGDVTISGIIVSNGVSSPQSGLAQDILSSVTTVDGHISLSGNGAETVDDIAFYAGSSASSYSNITSVNGNIEIRVDSFTAGTTNLKTTNGYIAYLPRSTNRHIGLGSADIRGTGGTLGLSDADLDFATAPTIKIGDSNIALVGVTAPISRASPTNMEITGSGLMLTALLDLNGGDLLINTNGTITGASGVDISAGTVSFGTENGLVFAINGPVADTGYPQFNVVGTVNLTDVTLVFTRSYTLTSGEVYTLVVNDGTDAVIGTFKGVAEGMRIPDFLGSQLDGIISYVGGDGNDVVVSVTNPLPVTLVSFTGKKTADNQNLLKWFTTEEKDFDRFEIQRSEDAKAFETIGSVDGATATSTALNSYEFADNQTKGDHYYRLKMVDTDGTFDYSKIISINSFGQSADEQQIVGSFYPNPSSGRVYVDLYAIENDSWTITVLDVTGRAIQSEQKVLQKGMNKIPLDHLPSGLNLVRFENGKVNILRKVVKK